MSSTATDEPLRSFLEEVSLGYLRSGLVGAVAAYGVAAVGFLLLLPPPSGIVLGIAAGASAAALFALRRIASEAPPRLAHPVVAGVALLTISNVCLYMVATGNVQQSASFSVIVLACSFFFLSRVWIAAIAATAVVGFGVTLVATGLTTDWTQLMPSLVISLSLAAVVHEARLRTFRRLATLRMEETKIRAELESSVVALQDSKERLRQLAESSSEGIVIHEAGKILDVNTAAAQILGSPREALLGHTLSGFFLRDPHAALPEAVSMGRPFEATITRPDGSRIPVEVGLRTAPFRGHLESVTTLRDISERRRLQDLLTERRELERLIITIASDLVKRTPSDLEPGVRQAVEAIARVMEADHGHALLLRPSGRVRFSVDWFADKSRARHLALGDLPRDAMPWIARRMAGLEAVHIPDVGGLPPQAGADRAFLRKRSVRSLIAVPIAQGERVIGSLAFAATQGPRPWSEETVALLRIAAEVMAGASVRQRALEDLEASEARKAAILEAALDCIITINPHGRVVEFNPAAEKTLGYRRADVIGMPLRDLVVPERLRTARDDGLRPLFVTAERPILGRHTETTACRADGTEFAAELAVVAIDTVEGPGFTVYLRDITERREIERLREELVATVSHELRTPLTSLRGFTELMLEKEFPAERQRKFLEVIRSEAVRLTKIVNDFLDMKRIESGRATLHRERIDLRALLQEIEALFGRDDGLHEIKLDLDPAITLLRADPGQLRQVLINLVSNAIKFSPHGGIVTLGARNEAEGVLLWVSDEGIGVAPADMAGLFQKFFRVDNAETRTIGGTGLGLALVKEIVTAHGGRIWVESTVGSGSTFYVSLPSKHDGKDAGGESGTGSSVSYAEPAELPWAKG